MTADDGSTGRPQRTVRIPAGILTDRQERLFSPRHARLYILTWIFGSANEQWARCGRNAGQIWPDGVGSYRNSSLFGILFDLEAKGICTNVRLDGDMVLIDTPYGISENT